MQWLRAPYNNQYYIYTSSTFLNLGVLGKFYKSGAVSEDSECLSGVLRTSPDGVFTATVQSNGNFGVYNKTNAIWNSGTSGKGTAPYCLKIKASGNLVLLDKTMNTLWASKSSDRGLPPFSLEMQNDGNLVLYDRARLAIWSSKFSGDGDCLLERKSPNLRYRAVVQDDGNFVVYDNDNAIWNSETSRKGPKPYCLKIKASGNLVLLDSTTNELIWESKPIVLDQGIPPYSLNMQDVDGNLVLKDSRGIATWSSKSKSLPLPIISSSTSIIPPVRWLYTPNVFDKKYGMLVNTENSLVFVYTINDQNKVATSTIPFAALNSSMETRVILSVDSEGNADGRFLLYKGGLWLDAKVVNSSLEVMPSGTNPSFLFSSFPLPLLEFNANPWSCSQYDPQTRIPMYQSNAACTALVPEDKNDKLLTAYCSRWPVDSSRTNKCVTSCKDPSKVCHQGMKQLCQGDNLLSNVCKEFCRLDSVNCDQSLTQYCSKYTPNDLLTNPALAATCGCFMKPSIYTNFYSGFKEIVNLDKNSDGTSSSYSLRPVIPSCYFPACSSPSSIKPFYFKSGHVACPNVQECIETVRFTNEGKITGGSIKIKQDNSCDFRPNQPK
jgi:outer membrane protein assembly factor BamB